MEGEVREKALQGKKAMESLEPVMKDRIKVKKALHDSITVPTLTYASETWTWNERQRSRIKAVEMSYLRGACSLNRIDSESKESVYGRFGMSVKGEGMSCEVM